MKVYEQIGFRLGSMDITGDLPAVPAQERPQQKVT